MLRVISSYFTDLRQRRAADRLACFHCGDSVKRSRAISVPFDGEARLVCCHGCAAVLKTVEQMGMCRQYREQKNQAAASNEA